MIPNAYPHQVRGTNRICDQPASLLHWDMGTGKTRAVVDYLGRFDPGLTLIACPAAVVDVWPREIAKYQPGVGATPIKGTAKQKRETLERVIAERGIAVINYESTISKRLKPLLLDQYWNLLVLDEIHRIKSARGKTSLLFAEIGMHARRRVGLTGTPMPHSPLDVFGQFRALDSRIFGRSYTRFRNQYAVMGGYRVNGRPVQIMGYQNMDDFYGKFHSITDRVKKEDVLHDLPERVHQYRTVDLPASVTRTYRELADELSAEVEAGTINAANAVVKVTRLQQLSSGFAVVGDEPDEQRTVELHGEKRKALAELLTDDIPSNEPVVVFARFARDLDAIHKAAEAAGRRCDELSGRRKDFTAYWQAVPGPWAVRDDPAYDGGLLAPVAAVQIQSGGTGIDLTAAHTAVYYSQTYSLGDYDQSLARLHRPGQRHNVTYIHLLANGTIDFDIYDALQRRADVIERVLDGSALSQRISA